MSVWQWVTRYLISVGDALSQFFCVLFFFSFNANESLSRRCYDQRGRLFFWTLMHVIDAIFYGITFILTLGRNPQTRHCEWAYRNDVKRAESLLNKSRLEHDNED